MTSRQEREHENLKRHFVKLSNSQRKRFPPLRAKLNATEKKGVYVIFNPQGEVVHVGRTPRGKKGIYQRLGDHMSGNSSFTKKYLKNDSSKLRDGYQFQCLAVGDARLRALLEAYAVGQLCPAHIGTG